MEAISKIPLILCALFVVVNAAVAISGDSTYCQATYSSAEALLAQTPHQHRPQTRPRTRVWQEQEFSLLGYKFHLPFVGHAVDSDLDDSDSDEGLWLDGLDAGSESVEVEEHELSAIGEVDPKANVFKLKCEHVGLWQVNQEILSPRSSLINYHQLMLVHVPADISNPLKLPQNESVREFSWQDSNLKDEPLRELFTRQPHCFEYMERLNLVENHLECLHWVVPQVTRRLKVLKMSGNRLSNCRLVNLQHMKQLEELYLDRNEISSLPQRFLGELSELRMLNLSQNLLTELPRDIFVGALKLERLYLSGNRLSVLPFQLFQTSRDLQVLDLSDNRLLSFPDNFFARNGQLRQLHLQRNQLKSIGKHSLYSLRELRQLDLSQNSLTIIDRKAFECFFACRKVLNLRCMRTQTGDGEELTPPLSSQTLL